MWLLHLVAPLPCELMWLDWQQVLPFSCKQNQTPEREVAGKPEPGLCIETKALARHRKAGRVGPSGGELSRAAPQLDFSARRFSALIASGSSL